MREIVAVGLVYKNSLRSRVAKLSQKFPVFFTQKRARRFVIVSELISLLLPAAALVGASHLEHLGWPFTAVAPTAAGVVGACLIWASIKAFLGLVQQRGLSLKLGITELLVAQRECLLVLVPLLMISFKGSTWNLVALLYLLIIGIYLPKYMPINVAVSIVIIISSNMFSSGLASAYRNSYSILKISDALMIFCALMASFFLPRLFVPYRLARRVSIINSLMLLLSILSASVVYSFAATERFIPYVILFTFAIWVFLLRARVTELSTPESWSYLLFYLRSCGVDGKAIWKFSQRKYPFLLIVPVAVTVLLAIRFGVGSAILMLPILVALEHVLNQAAIMDKTIVLPLSQAGTLPVISRVGFGAMGCVVIIISASGVFAAGAAVDFLSISGIVSMLLLLIASILVNAINSQNIDQWSEQLHASS